MYKIRTSAVYIRQSVLEHKVCVERMERMMACIDANKVEVVSDERLKELSFTCWPFKDDPSDYRGIHSDMEGPVIIFERAEWPRNDEPVEDWESPPFKHPWFWQADTKKLRDQGIVCQNGYQLCIAQGCLHKCSYCRFTRAIRIFLDIEEGLARLDMISKKDPKNKLYFCDGHSDVLCFEPEMGVSEMLVNYFAKQDDKYINLTTKSANVDHLLGLNHKGRTIISWTISCDTVSQLIERGTPSLQRRVEAMRKCQDAGYIVRCRFSPIIPFKNWQEDNRAMIEQLFEAVQPDMITLWGFVHTDFEDVSTILDLDMLDEAFLCSAKESIEEMRDDLGRPFPLEMRARIYRFMIGEIKRVSPNTPVGLCLEKTDMWKLMATDLGDATPDNFLCNCGAACVPGTNVYDELTNTKKHSETFGHGCMR